jgi:putative transposase
MLDPLPIDLPDRWVDEVNTPIEQRRLESLRQSVNRQAPFGQADWCVQQAALNGLECTLRPRGRPKKHTNRCQIEI